MDVFDNALFIFCGTRKDRVKALCWKKSGFLLSTGYSHPVTVKIS